MASFPHNIHFKLKKTCIPCSKSHQLCDGSKYLTGRPCSNCINKNIPNKCVYEYKKLAKYLFDEKDLRKNIPLSEHDYLETWFEKVNGYNEKLCLYLLKNIKNESYARTIKSSLEWLHPKNLYMTTDPSLSYLSMSESILRQVIINCSYVFAFIGAPSMVWGIDGRVYYFNHEFEAITQWDNKKISHLSFGIFNLLDPPSIVNLLIFMADASQDRCIVSQTYLVSLKNGETGVYQPYFMYLEVRRDTYDILLCAMAIFIPKFTV